ncbi:MAG TPA: serine/threonine-protein kinase [Pirellulales bacterium]
MSAAVVSLNDAEDEAMNPHVTEAEPEAASRPAAMKFAYASGSRPLEGYTLKRGIGRGGFGEVYFAVSDAGKEVALKLIRRNLDVELRGVTQCLNLKHPNLLSLFDIKQDERGDNWVVMEYVAGDSLEALVERNPDGVPENEVLAWFQGIAAGVCYLHDHGIVHRDLKPGNIFSDEGIVKIGDYGLSKFISASRRSGQTESVGTVHYMAPEISNGRYGKEIDIYALGIILYEMLTGHVPFEGESVGEVLMKHLTAEPNLEGVAEPYRSAIAKTLTKDPEARIRTVGELLTLLPVPTIGTVGNVHKGVGRPAAGAMDAEAVRTNESAAAEARGTSDVIPVAALPEEPIWRAVRTSWHSFTRQWDSGGIPVIAKGIIILGGIYGVLAYFGPLFLVAMAALPIYAVYCIVRVLVLDRAAAPIKTAPIKTAPIETAPIKRRPPVFTAAFAAKLPARPAPNAAPARPSPALTPPRQRAAHGAPAARKIMRQRIEELTGSLLASTAVAAIMSLFMSVVHANTLEPGRFAWLLLVSTLGAWLVLIPGKFWEGRHGEPTLRRLVLMVFGLALGAVAWGLKDFLFVSLHADWRLPPPVTEAYVSSRFYEPDGSPSLLALMAYFASLMFLVGWWKQADPGRGARLRLSPVLVAIFWGWLLSFFWPFPQPWGTMVAASMSLAVQLAATWQHPRRKGAV